MGTQERRHPNVVNVKEVDPRIESKGKFAFQGWRMGGAAGGKSLACTYYEQPAGKQAFPHHFHCGTEEAMFIIEGRGSVRIGAETIAVGPNDYIAFPPGPDHAHSITNSDGEKVLRYLCFSTGGNMDIVGYPDSKKFAFAAGIDPAKGLRSAWLAKIIKEQPSIDYYEGEVTD